MNLLWGQALERQKEETKSNEELSAEEEDSHPSLFSLQATAAVSADISTGILGSMT